MGLGWGDSGSSDRMNRELTMALGRTSWKLVVRWRQKHLGVGMGCDMAPAYCAAGRPRLREQEWTLETCLSHPQAWSGS